MFFAFWIQVLLVVVLPVEPLVFVCIVLVSSDDHKLFFFFFFWECEEEPPGSGPEGMQDDHDPHARRSWRTMAHVFVRISRGVLF